MKINIATLLFATLTTGLTAGLFYSWSISVTNGIGRTSDINYLHAFQSMNRAILNPAFFIIFFGPVILLPLATYLNIKPNYGLKFWSLLVATLLYFVGVMGVTILGNIPLNNSLEALQINSLPADELERFRLGFEGKWNRLNMIRTVTSVFAFLLLCYASVCDSIE